MDTPPYEPPPGEYPYRLQPAWDADLADRDGASTADAAELFRSAPPRIPDTVDAESLRARCFVGAARAHEALTAYARATGIYESESAWTALADLFNDVRHLCDLLGIDFDDVSYPSHYLAEIRGQT